MSDPAARRGLAWGLLAAAIWASYSVLARQAVLQGLHPLDLTLLRFIPGALVMAPLLLRWGWRDLGGIGWGRGLALALLSGPAFALLIMSGFAHAPLAHGAVVAPACQMLGGIVFAAWMVKQPPTRQTLAGAAVVLLGLACMGGDGLLQAQGSNTLLGDALFAAAGLCWGLFGALSRRWQVDPLRITGVSVVLSLLLFAPVYATFGDLQQLSAAPPAQLALQLLAQGAGAGLVALLAYSRAVALLGPSRAVFFGVMVPGAASLLAIPVLGEVPTRLQTAGIVAVVAGLLLALGRVPLQRR